MNKKLMALIGSVLMISMSFASPVLASATKLNELSKMVTTTGTVLPIFVIGAAAKPEDVASALNVAVGLAQYAKTTSEVITTGGVGETVTGGAKIATTGIQLTPWTNPQSVKGIITSSDIPTLLGTGTFTTASGGSYQYKQYLYIAGETTATDANSPRIVFERPSTENSAKIAVKLVGGQTAWTYKLTFSTPVSLGGTATDSTAKLQAILQGQTINMFGKDFVISDCTYTDATNPIGDITLLGGKNVVQVETGTPKTVSIDSKDYTISLSSVASETVGGVTYYTAIGDINGESFSLRAGQSTSLADTTLVAAIKVFQGKTGAADYAKIAIGADKVKLTNPGGSVTKGTTTVSEITSAITDSAASGWSALTLTYTPSSDKYLGVGDKVTDLFSSAFDFKFNSISASFDDTTARQTISFNPSGYSMQLTYKNAVDAEKTLYTTYTTDGTTWRWASAAVSSTGTDNSFRDIVFDEGRNISAIDQDYFVIERAGFSHVMQFTSYTPSTNELTFTDESSNTITATASSNAPNATADLIVDGNTFKVFILDNATKTINIDLNGNSLIAGTPYAGYGCAANCGQRIGREYSNLVPKMITSGQGGLYFYKGWNQSITNATLETKYVDIGLVGLNATFAAAGTATGTLYVGATNLGTFNAGQITNFTGTAATGYMDIVVNCSAAATAGWTCSVGLGTSTTGILTKRGFVLVEEATQGATTHNWIYLPVAYSSTTVRQYIDTPVIDDANAVSGTTYNVGILGTNTQYKGMTTYGSLIEYVSDNLGGSATIKYPDIYLYGNVYVLTPTGTITSGTSTSGKITTDKLLPITGDIVKLDTEVTASDKTGNDLVVVGGPCVNKIAADVMGKTYPACGSDSGITSNTGLIQLFADKYATGKSALLIAGWEAAHTDLAGRLVQTGFPGATDIQKAGTKLTVTGTVSSPAYS